MTEGPSWQTDPTGRHDHRYWDGAAWTDHVADAGVAGTDPYDTGPPVPEPESEPDQTPDPVAGALGPDAPRSPADDPTRVVPGAWDDPTTTTPVAQGPAPSDPTAPWPIVDDIHPPTDGDGDRARAGAQGATDTSRVRLLLVVAAVVIVAVIVALAVFGGDDDGGGGEGAGSVSARLAGALQDTEDLDAADAECVSEYVVDELGASRLSDVDFRTGSPPPELEDDLDEAYRGALEHCDVPVGVATGGGLGSGGTAITLPEDLDAFQDLLTQEYETSLGLPPAKADCLAAAMTAAVSAGEVGGGDAFADFFGHLDECGITLSELSGGSP